MKRIILLIALVTIFTNAFSQSDSLRIREYRGIEAAERYYTGYKNASTTTFIVSLLNPLLGLAPAIGATRGTPSDLFHPGYDKLKDDYYHLGYTQEAKRIRSQKVWKNYFYGTLINLAATAIVFSVIKKDNKPTDEGPKQYGTAIP